MNFFKTRGFVYGLAILLAIGFFYAGENLKGEQQQVIPLELQKLSDGPVVKTKGSPLVGGPFALTDHNGKEVTDKDFLGKYMMVYFGYTFCPDVCPTSLQVMIDAMDILGEEAEKITPVLITIDPARDTPQVLKNYVAQFHPRLVGLTGSDEAIKRAAKGYRVYRAKVEDEELKGKDEDYLMDHTSITYLMGPDGKFIKHFAHGYEPAKMAERLKTLLK